VEPIPEAAGGPPRGRPTGRSRALEHAGLAADTGQPPRTDGRDLTSPRSRSISPAGPRDSEGILGGLGVTIRVKERMELSGRWQKESTEPCAARYPAEIEFREATYLATKGPDQRFILWDAGIYRIEAPDKLLISIATDEVLPYVFAVSGERVTFTDADGCEFSYQRLPGQ
jgi:hypothetical protein